MSSSCANSCHDISKPWFGRRQTGIRDSSKKSCQSTFRFRDMKRFDRKRLLVMSVALAFVALSACATPARMHDEAQLNSVALGCGLALGELIQDESEKRLLLTVHQDTNPQQSVCVARWARRNGLKAVFVNMRFPEEPKT